MSEKSKQYIYITQGAESKSACKIGKTNDLERRLKEYNSMTGNSKDNFYTYLFSCEVKDMAKLENDITAHFKHLRQDKSREMYFYNPILFEDYVNFIKSHELFIKEITPKIDTTPKVEVKIIKKTTPTLKERGLTAEQIMKKARKADNDEFYTRLEDIEKELEMYPKSTFKDKVIFCNCDDAVDDDERRASAFSIYFLRNFKRLGLKKLICTHFSGPVDLFHQGPKGYIFTKEGFTEKKDYPKNYNGSFDHPISLQILNEEADLVCTNPPFSRAIDYWKVLIDSGKKFIIISNVANPVTTAFIPYFKNKKAWAGYNRIDYYQNPKRQLVEASGHWYCNVPIKNRPKFRLLKIMPLAKIPAKFKKIDDNGTLLVDNCYIPSDYDKPFGVSARAILNGVLEKGYKIIGDKQYIPYIKKEAKFARVLIQREV